MDIEEVKRIVKGNAFPASHLSSMLVVDLELVLDTLDDLATSSNVIPDVRLSLPSNEVINIEAKVMRTYPKNLNHLANMQNAFIDGANWIVKEVIEGNEA